MYGGENNNLTFPFCVGEHQFIYDSNTSTQLRLFENLASSCPVELVNYTNNQNITGAKPSKKSKGTEDISREQALQFSLNNISHDKTEQWTCVNNPDPVSTGLKLSYDDEERNSSVTSASGSLSTLPAMLSLGDNLRSRIDHGEVELNHCIRVQEEQMMKAVKEMRHRHKTTLLSTIERSVMRKLRKKEAELEGMNKKNQELVDRIKEVAAEAQSWQYRARFNESVVNVLQTNLKQALAQGADRGREGCGDSEVDDATSSAHLCQPVAGAAHGTGLLMQQMICRACGRKEVSFLVLPCRHLCLCSDCDGCIDMCPICKSSKAASVQVFLY